MPRITGRKNHQLAPRDQPALPRQHMRIDHAGDQDRDRRIERQHVMRQLGDHQFQHDPGRHDPAQQKLRALLAPRRPDARHRHGGERRARPERHPEQREVIARRRAVRLLGADHLAHQVVADRFGEETRRRTRLTMARNQGSTRTQSQITPGDRPQRRKPAHRAVASPRAPRCVSPTNITISGPLIRMPAASAVQKIAGKVQPASAERVARARRDRRAPSRPSRRRR